MPTIVDTTNRIPVGTPQTRAGEAKSIAAAHLMANNEKVPQRAGKQV